MKRFLLAFAILICFYSDSFASVPFEGAYTGRYDYGLWGAIIDPDGFATVFMYSGERYMVRARQTYVSSDNSINTVLKSAQFGDCDFYAAANNSGIVSGSWQTPASYGGGTLSGIVGAAALSAPYSGQYSITMDGKTGLVTVFDNGTVTIYVYNNDESVYAAGIGFINKDGFYFGQMARGTISFFGSARGKSLEDIYFNDSAYGLRLGGVVTGNSDPGTNPQSCRIIPKSLTLDITSFPRVNQAVTFNTAYASDCASPTVYYYYSYCPDYGTSNHDPNHWVQMSNGFQTQSSITHAFTSPGNYVVVAWVSPTPSAPDPIQMVGCTITVDP